jgi:hypothetical protein
MIRSPTAHGHETHAALAIVENRVEEVRARVRARSGSPK